MLSQIILDHTSAADRIPKNARGRFITGDGTVFQGYLFDEGQREFAEWRAQQQPEQQEQV